MDAAKIVPKAPNCTALAPNLKPHRGKATITIPMEELYTNGKKNTFLLSQAISIVGYALFWWCLQPENPMLMLLPLPLFAFGIGGLFTPMTSMTADVCDLDELNTGSRREGTFGAIYWWMVKFGMAVAGGMSGLIMGLVGFVPDAAVQPPGAVTGIRIAPGGLSRATS